MVPFHYYLSIVTTSQSCTVSRYSWTLVENCQYFWPHLYLAPPFGVTPMDFHQHFCTRRLQSTGYHAALTAWWLFQSFKHNTQFYLKKMSQHQSKNSANFCIIQTDGWTEMLQQYCILHSCATLMSDKCTIFYQTRESRRVLYAGFKFYLKKMSQHHSKDNANFCIIQS